MRSITSLILLGTCLSAAHGWAASFDCAKAGTTVEKVICRHGDLSLLDDRMASAYKIRLKDWNGANAAYVKADQRAYLRYYHEINHPQESEIEPICDRHSKTQFLPCLRDLMMRRVRELENPDYKLTGVYYRGPQDARDGMILIWPAATGVAAMRVTLKQAGQIKGTWLTPDTDGVKLAGADTLVAQLPAEDGTGTGCTLTLKVTAASLQASPSKACGSVSLGGTYHRDASDLLINHELDIEF